MASDADDAISDGTSPYTPTAASMVSMFQTNSVAIRAERMITWKRRRSTACLLPDQLRLGWPTPRRRRPLI